MEAEVEAQSEEGGVNRFSRYTEALPGPVVTVISDAHARWSLFPAFQMSTCAACVTHLCRLSVCDQDTVCFPPPQHTHSHIHSRYSRALLRLYLSGFARTPERTHLRDLSSLSPQRCKGKVEREKERKEGEGGKKGD